VEGNSCCNGKTKIFYTHLKVVILSFRQFCLHHGHQKKLLKLQFSLCRTKYFSHFNRLGGKVTPPPPPKIAKKKNKGQQIQNACDFNTHERDFCTPSAISTRRVRFYMLSTHTSVILTHTNLIRTRSSVIYTQTV
jgi:hypothetical protein